MRCEAQDVVDLDPHEKRIEALEAYRSRLALVGLLIVMGAGLATALVTPLIGSPLSISLGTLLGILVFEVVAWRIGSHR